MKNKTWRKVTSLLLCLGTILSWNMPARALTIDNIELTPKASVIKSDAQVQTVMDKIDGIGTVEYTDDCLGKIIEAENLFAALSDSQKDQIENAISLGGDSDTLAAITGSIAEAAYGIPEWIKVKAISYLDDPLKDVLRRWKNGYPGNWKH